MTNNANSTVHLNSLGYCFLYILLQALIASIAMIFTKDIGIINFVSYAITIILFCYIYRDYLKKCRLEFKSDFKKHFINILVVYILLIIGMYISATILSKVMHITATNDELIRDQILSSPILMTLCSSILGPICEEFNYRLVLKDIFKNKKLAYATYSILFAFLHILASSNLLETLYFIPYLFMSLAFGYGLYKTDNIYMSMIIHILHNSLTCMVLFLM